jgi:hypothetical protein
VAVLIGAACGHAVPATPLNYTSRANFANVDRPREFDYGALAGAVAPVFHTLHDQVVTIVASPELKLYLEDVDALLANPGADPISGRRFLAIYLGRDRLYEIAPICYHLKAGGSSETGATGLSAKRSGCKPGSQTVADVTLRSATYRRAQSKTLEEVACAVNTLAHEWTHAITRTDPVLEHRMAFEDDKHDEQAGAVASYTLGAFAQCVFLARATGAPDRFDVRRCVEEVGTNDFDPSTCAGGWAARFVTRPRA